MDEENQWEKAHKCLNELVDELPDLTTISANRGTAEDVSKYYENAQMFNRRFNENPYIIVYCESSKDVQITFNTAIKYKLPIRVRGGGHDHEGESSGTNTVVIDLSKMTTVDIDPETKIAKIGPGNRFTKLTTDLARKDVMVAHGTCATVCIAGFTLGGGWGPWTRKHGMNCEHLVGAKIVLGDGNLVDTDDEDIDEKLLWALKGGGGMSYGIVTEFRIQTFDLPEELIKFQLIWNDYIDPEEKIITHENRIPTLDILKAWEAVIQSTETSKLIGTNIKINGRSAVENFDYTKIHHNCKMYGYWEGTEEDLRAFIDDHFKATDPDLYIEGFGGTKYVKNGVNYGDNLMDSWDRESYHQIRMNILMDQGMDLGDPIPPDKDLPAPHKITSRLGDKEGLSEKGYEQLFRSLTSPLLFDEGRSLGLFTYITIGAITGDYYRKHPNGNSAFPYKDKLYTIQYQTWWNTDEKYIQDQDSKIYDYTNRALDWMETCRDFDIPNTSGAFISFKDSSIPTEVYFDKSYDELKQIKEDFCRDSSNHFRSRKTII